MGHAHGLPSHRRPRAPGATIFYTVALAERGSDLLVRRVGLLREAVRPRRAARLFEIDAWVVLPDHLPCIWTLPEGDRACPARNDAASLHGAPMRVRAEGGRG